MQPDCRALLHGILHRQLRGAGFRERQKKGLQTEKERAEELAQQLQQVQAEKGELQCCVGPHTGSSLG